MNAIQVGDTVEVLENNVAPYCYHPTENRFLQKGDRIVVMDVDSDNVYYAILGYDERWYHLPVRFVKKVVSNEVEVKFR
jgi:hypothetical protein